MVLPELIVETQSENEGGEREREREREKIKINEEDEGWRENVCFGVCVLKTWNVELWGIEKLKKRISNKNKNKIINVNKSGPCGVQSNDSAEMFGILKNNYIWALFFNTKHTQYI